uniref:Putative ovule protein n=1 Tax=Solanum chacoense TaxID=4108 RepID=A0A0V0GI76_SOLCH
MLMIFHLSLEFKISVESLLLNLKSYGTLLVQLFSPQFVSTLLVLLLKHLLVILALLNLLLFLLKILSLLVSLLVSCWVWEVH